MEGDYQRELADVLRDSRERLHEARGELTADVDGVAPLDLLAARIHQVETRMFDVETALRADAEHRRRTPRRWLRDVSAPRLTTLRQHAPTKLVVPRGYFTVDPPAPAPTISIVTPSLDQRAFLERALYSVISQNYPALEYVVQDGGSTDRSVELLRRYERSLTSWASEPDGGQADALNRGFSRTTGEIMAYLNSDDLLLPGSLAYVARYFVAHPDVDVVYGHRVIVTGHDAEVGVHVLPPHDNDVLGLFDFVPQETLFWRRRAWEAAGGAFDSELSFALDWDLLLRLRDSGATMVRLPRFLGAFRVHDAQKTITDNDRYLLEANALRARANGHALSEDQAFVRAAPYMRRHVAHHLWNSARARLPAARERVRTEPLEPWFRGTPAD